MDASHSLPVLGESRLGYGCASLMGQTGRTQALRLLSIAFDAGITHFDVARSYGYGEAEGVLGRFLSGRRDAVTVTTKVGILPPRRRLLGPAKLVGRGLASLSPRLRGGLRRQAGRMVEHGRFGADESRASFEQSLRELRTDHVDVLLLHEARAGDVTDELREFLDTCVTSGKARAVGIASPRDDARVLWRNEPDRFSVVQIPDTAVEPQLPDELLPSAATIVTHSVLKDALPALTAHADLDPALLPRLLLAAALRRNPHGVVLMSTRDDGHLRDNAAVLHAPPDAALLESLQEAIENPRREQNAEY
jgi:aryl-alcohol dehydrogenase-like predicted oxidoreductase